MVKFSFFFLKLLDWISPTEVKDRWTSENLLVVAILSLILHHSTNGRLIEASKSVLFHTPVASATKSVLHEACSKGPALVDDHEGTNRGKTIILVLFLVYFSMRRSVSPTRCNHCLYASLLVFFC